MVQIQNDILVIFWKVQQSPPICFIFTFIVGKCPLQWISIGPMSRARCPWKYRSQSKYSAVEHRNQQEVEKVPKQTERREYWFQKYIFPSVIAIASTWWFSSCYCKHIMEWPIGNDGLHSECRKAKEPQTVLSAELVSTFSCSALLCIQNSQQLSLTTRATSPDYLSSASWMPTAAFSLKLSLPVRKILSTQ